MLYKNSVKSTAYDYILIALAGKLAHADGEICKAEIDAFSSIFVLRSSAGNSSRSLLIEAAHDPVKYEHYAKRLITFFQGNKKLYKEIVYKLFRLAASDGPVNSDEIVYLKHVVEILGLSDEFFLQTLRQYIVPPSGSPYDVLEVSKTVGYVELKDVYYKAVRACHPDKLAFLDAPQDMIELVNHRLSVLSEAYATIKKQRKLRKAA